MRRAVFLDRDGVLLRLVRRGSGAGVPPSSVREVEILPGVPEACAALKDSGFLLVVVTNQPDVARGTQRRDVVESINAVVRRRLPIDAIRVCYHDDADACACRKPRPGMLLEAARELAIDLGASYVVGDDWRDVAAGRAAGCRTLLVDNRGEPRGAEPDWRVSSLLGAVEVIRGATPAGGSVAE